MNSKIIARTAVLLSLAVMSQFFKNLSAYITGSVINCILIISAIYCGTAGGIILSAVLPVTSWLISGSPVMTAVPAIIPCTAVGNLILTLTVRFMTKNNADDRRFVLSMVIGSILKAAFMTLTVSCLLLGLLGLGSGLPEAAVSAAKLTFSVTQLAAGLIGAIPAYAVKKALDKTVQK